ncbi:hypothetical protein D3C77_705350 [compost metagenome]
MVEADAAFGEHHRACRADVLEQVLGQRLADQFDALVLYLQVAGQRAVAFGDLAQQVLGFEVQLM